MGFLRGFSCPSPRRPALSPQDHRQPGPPSGQLCRVTRFTAEPQSRRQRMEPGHGIAQLILGSPHLSHRLGIAPYPELNLKRCPRPAGSLAKNNSGVSEDRKRLIDSPLRIMTTGCRTEVLSTFCCPSCSNRHPWSRSGPLPTWTTHWKRRAENALRKVRWHRTRPKPKRESRTI